MLNAGRRDVLKSMTVLTAAGLVGVRQTPFGDALFPSFVALLDISLVIIIFKGDVPLT